MSKRIFGSLDSFVETSETSLKLGRLVANFGFLQALLNYGDFDEYHIYCPTLDNLRLVQQRLESTLGEAVLGRVVLSHHFNLMDALGETDFAAFHLSDWFWYLPKMAWLRARYARHPFPLSAPIHSLNGPDMPAKVGELAASPLRPGDSVFCTSTRGRGAFANYLELAGGAGRPRLDLVPLGVAEEYFVPRDPRACRQRVGIPASAFCLLYVGRLSVATKADLVPLLYLLARLRREAALAGGGPVDWKLVLAGGADPSDLDNLAQAVGELGLEGHVLMKPRVSDDEKLDLYGAADVFVSPVDNLQETFGISIVEAMAAGLPVVCSDFDGYRDLVREGQTGFRIPTLWGRPPAVVRDLFSVLEPNLSALAFAQGTALDQEIFFQRLVALAGNPELCRSLGEAGRQVAQSEYAWRAVIGRCGELWREMKAQSLAAGLEPRPRASPAGDLTAIFRDYPSAHLDAGTEVAATALAASILAGEMPMPAVYADIALLSSGDVLSEILGELGRGSRSVGALQARVSARLGIPADFTAYQIAWLLKYGLLRQT